MIVVIPLKLAAGKVHDPSSTSQSDKPVGIMMGVKISHGAVFQFLPLHLASGWVCAHRAMGHKHELFFLKLSLIALTLTVRCL